MARFSWLFLIALLLVGLACDDVPVVASSTSNPSGGIGGVGASGGSQGGQGPGGSASGAGGASLSPLYLGVVTNTAAGGEPPVLAELRAFAAGVRLVAVELSFGDFDAEELAVRLSGYADQQLRVVVTLLVVDRHEAHRPSGLEQTPWNDPAMKSRLSDTLAAIEAGGSGILEAIAIGRNVDAYLEAHPGEAAALTELLKYGAETGEPEVPRGVGLAHPLSATPTLTSLAAAGEILVASYLPGIGSDAPSSAPVAQHLDAMATIAGVRPVLLLEVGFPSAPSIGASDETQLARFDAFFTALAPRRAQFPWLLVHQLHDLDPAACEDLAVDQDEDPAGSWAAYACHTGLRTPAGEPKPAWGRFLQATAAYASP